MKPASVAAPSPYPISDNECAIQVGRRHYRFQRHCPHRHADLAACGYYDPDAKAIRCSWHNLPFDLETGASPLAHVAALKITRVPETEPND